MHLVPIYLYDKEEIIERARTLEDFMNDYKLYRKVQGVYFLILEDEIVYVGSTQAMRPRLQDHRKDPTKYFDKIFVLEQPDEDIYAAMEVLYIGELQPKYNKTIRMGGKPL